MAQATDVVLNGAGYMLAGHYERAQDGAADGRTGRGGGEGHEGAASPRDDPLPAEGGADVLAVVGAVALELEWAAEAAEEIAQADAAGAAIGGAVLGAFVGAGEHVAGAVEDNVSRLCHGV